MMNSLHKMTLAQILCMPLSNTSFRLVTTAFMSSVARGHTFRIRTNPPSAMPNKPIVTPPSGTEPPPPPDPDP